MSRFLKKLAHLGYRLYWVTIAVLMAGMLYIAMYVPQDLSIYADLVSVWVGIHTLFVLYFGKPCEEKV